MNPEILRFIRYLSFKMSCLQYQEANPLTLDVVKAERHLQELTEVINEKTEALAKVMPKVPEKEKNKPANLYKKDGTYSKFGKEWFDLLKELKLPPDTEGPVVVSYKDGNPGSSPQVKEWLFSLGWKPDHFKYERNKLTGDEKKIPQVRYTTGDRKGELTDSVLKLKDREPSIEILEGLTVAQHRKGVFAGFLKANREGTIVASAGGFTNTLRLKHKEPVVNLPGVDKAWGVEVRGCIVAPTTVQYIPTNLDVAYSQEDAKFKAVKKELCGSDVSSLESSTKRHFMWPHDPEYVKEMSQPGFDEHINLAKFAGAITQEDEGRYSAGNGSDLKPIRNKFKPANYAGIYGVREKTLSRQTGMSIAECKELLDAYWKRNWSVIKIAKEQYVKTLADGSMWLKNPVSGFYYSLRFEKDIFSTLNQGTGVFVFDSWVMRMRRKGIHPQLQYHDEVLFAIDPNKKEETTKMLEESMSEVNQSLKLNVDITVDVKYGKSYAEVH